MPVRIYDIAKKLGKESKEVLAKAKDLGISAAKVPSSSLDKITAEFLEEQLGGGRATVSSGPTEPTPVRLVSEASHAVTVVEVEPAPAEAPDYQADAESTVDEPAYVQETAESRASAQATSDPLGSPATEGLPATEPAKPAAPAAPRLGDKVGFIQLPPKPAPKSSAPSAAASQSAPTPVGQRTHAPQPAPVPKLAPAPSPVASAPAAATPTPRPVESEATPTVVPAPSGPRIGDKVGFIQLPTRPAPRVGDKVGSVKLPPRPAQQQGGRPGAPGSGPMRRDDHRGGGMQNRGPSGGTQQGGRPAYQQSGARPGQGQYGQGRQESTRPGEARFVPPTTGTLISVKPPVVVRELAEKLNRKPFQLIADLMELGVFANVNQSIDEQVAQKICAKYGFRFEVEKRERGAGLVHAPAKKVEVDIEDKPEEMKPRAPVVTIMGHVDHGKTTLLDVIRKSDVAAGEAGGITQHIGAYTISFPHPERKDELQQITFLDTPGHAAFSAMRARGANVTDVVVLVVAANDGVMPQTLEALSHAQAAKVPIIVAVNKCDHPAANPMRVRQQLQDKGLVPEEWGGSTIFADVSALTKKGVDKLLELILLQAEIMELKANPTRKARGNVIESGLEPGGPTATVLVRKGTLKVGDALICGQYWGKVRALINEEGKRLKEAIPSVAVKVLGLNGVPEAGLEFSVLEDEKTARTIAEERAMEARSLSNEARAKVTLENLFATLDATNTKTLRVVVKADTQGSVEAIVEALKKIESNQVQMEVIHSAVGTITESDVSLASASSAIILGFHTRIDNGIADIAKRERVQIKLYSIIYELIDQVREAMAGLLDPVVREVITGSAEVRQIFELSKGGNVAGCMVTAGRILKGKVRLLRRKNLIYEGSTASLRRFQDEVNEVRAGMECGIRIDGFNDFQTGDTIECYTTEKTAGKL